MNKIIAVDFDGTLCHGNWPDIGEPNIRLINKLLKLQRKGYKIILWTCREGEPLHQAIEWCKEFNLVFDAINDNLPEIIREKLAATFISMIEAIFLNGNRS